MNDRWPQMMKRATAAEYVDMTEPAFEREIAKGRLPAGVMFGGKLHWHKTALDRSLAIIAGERLDSVEQDFWNRGQAA